MKFNIGITGHNGSLGKIIKKNKSKNNYFYYGHDIRNKKKLFEWCNNNNLNIIFHLAAIVPIKSVNKSRKKAYDVNFVGTKNLVDIAKKREKTSKSFDCSMTKFHSPGGRSERSCCR